MRSDRDFAWTMFERSHQRHPAMAGKLSFSTGLCRQILACSPEVLVCQNTTTCFLKGLETLFRVNSKFGSLIKQKNLPNSRCKHFCGCRAAFRPGGFGPVFQSLRENRTLKAGPPHLEFSRAKDKKLGFPCPRPPQWMVGGCCAA